MGAASRSRPLRTNTRWKVVAALVSTLVALAGAEIATRVLVPQIGWRPFDDAILGWSSLEVRAFDSAIQDDERDRLRVLFLGDSYLAGSGVDDLDERFAVEVAALSRGRIASRILATGGWGTDQQLLAFRGKGRAWKPHVVVVAFCANNDNANIVSYARGQLGRKPYFVLDGAGGLSLRGSTGKRMSDRELRFDDAPVAQSYLLDLLRALLLEAPADREAAAGDDPRYVDFHPEPRPLRREIVELRERLSWSPPDRVSRVSAYIHEDHEHNAYQWRLQEAILAKLGREVAAIGARLVVMVLPVPYETGDIRFVAGSDFEHRFATPDGPFTFRTAEPVDRLRQISQRLGIGFFDPTRAFLDTVVREDAMADCWPEPRNNHFSAYGHRILARQLLELLEADVEAARG